MQTLSQKRTWLISYLVKIWSVLLPNICQLCGQNSDQLVCAKCCTPWLKNTQLRCLRCAHKLAISTYPMPSTPSICGACITHPPSFISTHVLGDYTDPQEYLIWALKFDNGLPLARFFAIHLASLMQQTLSPLDHSLLLLPIPLSKKRLTQRGYNQSWEIARRLSRLTGVAARADILIKVKETSPQISLPFSQRSRNLRGAFLAKPEVVGKHIILVDDVMTSGATLEEAARSLLRNGASSVRNYVVLRTPKA